MHGFRWLVLRGLFVLLLALTAAAVSLYARPAAASMTWQAIAGAQTGDKAIQALAFLPNDLTVDAGDSITWTFPTDEIHSVTFDTLAVDSGRLKDGQTFTASFPTAGTFTFHCSVHPRGMTGTVRVQPAGAPPPHDQTFYDQEGHAEGQKLLVDGLKDRAQEQASTVAGPGKNAVTIGAAADPGDIITTSGGKESYMLARFLPGTLSVKTGQTITWTALDIATPHTVTFGGPPPPPNPSAVNLKGPGEQTSLAAPYPQLGVGPLVSSGFLGNFGGTRGTTFAVTFNAPGTYQYYCELHKDLGMTGTIIVH